MICSSKLLARTQIILFLNKCDLLEKKLESGVRVGRYVPSYGDRKNDARTVTQCKSLIIFWYWNTRSEIVWQISLNTSKKSSSIVPLSLGPSVSI